MCEILFSLIRLISKNSQFFSSEFLLNKNRAFLLKLHFFKVIFFFLLIFAPLYFQVHKNHTLMIIREAEEVFLKMMIFKRIFFLNASDEIGNGCCVKVLFALQFC